MSCQVFHSHHAIFGHIYIFRLDIGGQKESEAEGRADLLTGWNSHDDFFWCSFADWMHTKDSLYHFSK
jgi:hypothetical protein